MTLKTFPFNGTPGTAITAANSGALFMLTSTGATQTYETSAAFQGTTGARFVSAGNGASGARLAMVASATQAAFSFRFKIPAAVPSANYTFFQVIDTSGNRVVQLNYRTDGTIQTNDKANTNIQVLSAAQAVAGTSFRFELVITSISTTAGAFTARAYSTGNSQVGNTATATAGNTGTVAMNGADVGLNATGPVVTFEFDSVQMNNGSTSEIGEYVANSTPPTVTAGGNQTTTPGTNTNLTCTATPANNDTIASYSWSLVSAIDNTGAAITGVTISNATNQTASFTPKAGTFGRYVFAVTATDSSGNTSTAATTKVFVPGTLITPIEVTSSSGWPTSAVSNVNDASDSTYVESGAVGSGSALVLRLAPLVAATSGFSLTVRSLVQATGGTQKVELLEGTTVRKDWGALAPGTSFADQVLSLSSTEMAAVGSWSELDLRFTQV